MKLEIHSKGELCQSCRRPTETEFAVGDIVINHCLTCGELHVWDESGDEPEEVQHITTSVGNAFDELLDLDASLRKVLGLIGIK